MKDYIDRLSKAQSAEARRQVTRDFLGVERSNPLAFFIGALIGWLLFARRRR